MVQSADISDVANFENVDDTMLYMAREGMKDKIDPNNLDISLIKERVLAYNNIYRTLHGVPELSRDSKIDVAAQKWSDHLSKQGGIMHESPANYGENLFMTKHALLPHPDKIAKICMHSFYMEGIGYDYNDFQPENFAKFGHFSQLLWKKSRKIGVGVSLKTSDPSKTDFPYAIIFCIKYDPPGNTFTKRQFIENVRPPLKGSTIKAPARQVFVSKTVTIADVAHINNMTLFDEYIRKEGLKDKSNPLNFDIPALKQWIVTYQNVYRMAHGLDDVVRHSEIEEAAQKWSDQLAKDGKDMLRHEQPVKYGEILFHFATAHLPKPEKVAKAINQAFYMEGKGYDYDKFNSANFKNIAHFSQMLWKGSKRIGVGVTLTHLDPTKNEFPHVINICLKYDPPGNILNEEEFLENVQPLVKDRKASTIPKKKAKLIKHGDISDVTEQIKKAEQFGKYMMREGMKDDVDPMTYDLVSLKEEIMFYHNVYRTMHSALDLVKDSALDAAAQKWSDTMAKEGKYACDPDRKYGQNIFMFQSSGFAIPEKLAKAMLHRFYLQSNGYDYTSYSPDSYKTTGNFTQIIWKNARRIGVGVTMKHLDSTTNDCPHVVYICIKYEPGGNINSREEYLENVRPPVKRS